MHIFYDTANILCGADIVILDAIAKRPKDTEQKIRMSSETTKAYWHLMKSGAVSG